MWASKKGHKQIKMQKIPSKPQSSQFPLPTQLQPSLDQANQEAGLQRCLQHPSWRESVDHISKRLSIGPDTFGFNEVSHQWTPENVTTVPPSHPLYKTNTIVIILHCLKCPLRSTLLLPSEDNNSSVPCLQPCLALFSKLDRSWITNCFLRFAPTAAAPLVSCAHASDTFAAATALERFKNTHNKQRATRGRREKVSDNSGGARARARTHILPAACHRRLWPIFVMQRG